MSTPEKEHSSYDLPESGGAPLSHATTTGGHTLDVSQPGFPVYHRRFANPGPLGLSAFATTTFLLSLINVGTYGVNIPHFVVGLAFGYGVLMQMLAGMWEFAQANTFAATAFSSYGGFWISFAFILSPWSGIGAAYAGATEEIEHAIASTFSPGESSPSS